MVNQRFDDKFEEILVNSFFVHVLYSLICILNHSSSPTFSADPYQKPGEAESLPCKNYSSWLWFVNQEINSGCGLRFDFGRFRGGCCRFPFFLFGLFVHGDLFFGNQFFRHQQIVDARRRLGSLGQPVLDPVLVQLAFLFSAVKRTYFLAEPSGGRRSPFVYDNNPKRWLIRFSDAMQSYYQHIFVIIFFY
jgi:hypothetical protein